VTAGCSALGWLLARVRSGDDAEGAQDAGAEQQGQEQARHGAEGGQTEQALRHLVGVLLHTPTTRAHELAETGRADEYIDALSALFGIEVADPAAAERRGIADAG